IGEFSGRDPDNDQVYFRLPENPNYPYNSSFRIINGKTLISSEDLFDRETLNDYKILVEAYDVYGGKITKEFTLARYDLPEGVKLVENIDFNCIDAIAENQNNLKIGDVKLFNVKVWYEKLYENKVITHRDTTYLNYQYDLSLEAGKFDNDFFRIEQVKIGTNPDGTEKLVSRIYSTKPLNYEQAKKAKIVVKAAHKKHPSDIFYQNVYDLNISDNNDAPSTLAISNASVNESDPAGTKIGILLAVDEDPSDLSFNFSIVKDQEDGSKFSISGRELYTSEPLKAGAYRINIKVTDDENAEYLGILEVFSKKAETEKTTPTISHFEDLSKKAADGSFVLSAYSNSDAKISYSLISGGEVAGLKNAKVTILKAGTAEIKASVSETDTYLPAEKTITLTVESGGEIKQAAITDFENLSKDLDKKSFWLTAQSNSDAKVRYTVLSGKDVITLNGAKAIIKKAGEAKIKAFVEATDKFTKADKTIKLTVFGNNSKQTPLIKNFSDLSLAVGKKPYVLSAHSDSDAKMKYQVVSGIAVTISGAELTAVKAGTAKIKAFVEATEAFKSNEKIVSVTVNESQTKTKTTISHFNNMNLFAGDDPQPLTADSNSPAKVQYVILSGSKDVAEIRSSLIYPRGAGEVQVRAFVEETNTHTGAEKIISVKVNGSEKVSPTFEHFENLTVNTATPPFLLTAFSTSDAKVEYSLESGEAVKLNGPQVTVVGVGEAVVKASVKSTDRYNYAEKVISIRVASLLGAEKNNASSAYPNPTDRFVTIEFSGSGTKDIKIFSLDGRVLQKTQTEKERIQIDLGAQENGYYLIQIKENDKLQVLRVQLRK
ncbi:MAG: T9SS type A sorting domain-containing protein, partial [Cytophagales bacterium]|nr:T9SS type A sorting domain-containing protein [Cytophagales bacterium]